MTAEAHRQAGSGRHAARVAGAILLSRIVGYARERVTAHFFGNDSAAADALGAALKIPNAIRNLLGEGTLSASFIPVYAGLNEADDKAPARELAAAVLGLLLLAVVVLAVLGIVFAPAITSAVAYGFDPERRRLTIALVRVLFPMTGMMVISAWCLGILNTHGRFFLPYAAPMLWNVFGIAALVTGAAWVLRRPAALDAELGHLALWFAWGLVAGAFAQVAVQLPVCWRLLGRLRVRFRASVPGVRDVVLAWLPMLAGAGVAQISSFIDTQLGSFVGPSGVSSLRYAQMIQILPVSMFGVSVAAVALPDLSRDAVGAAAFGQLRARVAAGFRRITFFIVPSSFLFAALGPVLIAALYQTGRFTRQDSLVVGGVLAAYGIGLLGQACVKLFASGFYALRDTRTPVKIAAASVALSSVLAWVLMRRFGVAGIALGSSLGAWVNVVFHLRDLDRRIGTVMRREDWRAFAIALVGAGAATAAAVAGAGVAARRGLGGPVGIALVAVAIFVVVYGAAVSLAGHPDARRLWHFLRTSRAS